MTLAIFIALIASFLWASSNHIDKFMITDVNENTDNIKILIVFSSLIAGIIFSPLWLILSKFSITISTISLICVITASFIYLLAVFLYLKALESNDASIIVIMFQLIPIFSFILAFILFKEALSIKQIIGSLIIILSAIIISLDFTAKNNKKKFRALLLMTLSSLCYAIYYILFDIAIRNSSYYSCAFWYQIGFLLLGIIFLFFKSFRKSFITAIKANGKRYFILNAINEAIDLIANLLVNFANLTIPIALANTLNGFQGMFVFIIGVLGTKFLPKYFNEDLNKKIVIQKVTCIILSIIGLTILVS